MFAILVITADADFRLLHLAILEIAEENAAICRRPAIHLRPSHFDISKLTSPKIAFDILWAAWKFIREVSVSWKNPIEDASILVGVGRRCVDDFAVDELAIQYLAIDNRSIVKFRVPNHGFVDDSISKR